jgi:hypothetical protein
MARIVRCSVMAACLIALIVTIGAVPAWAAGDGASYPPARIQKYTPAHDTSGRVSLLKEGGPDAFGYAWEGSTDPGGPVFNYVDISATGTMYSLGDDSSTNLELAEPFPYYDRTVTAYTLSSNGWLEFEAGAGGWIYALDADLHQRDGAIYVQYFPEDHKTIIQWYHYGYYSQYGNTCDFEIILDHANGTILYQYLAATAWTTDEPYVGIAPPNGVEGGFGIENSLLQDNYAILISQPPPAPRLAVIPGSYSFGMVRPGEPVSRVFHLTNTGRADLHVTLQHVAPDPPFRILDGGGALTLAPAESSTTTIQFSPTSLGYYTGELTIRSDDPDFPSKIVPMNGIASNIVETADNRGREFWLGFMHNYDNGLNYPLHLYFFITSERDCSVTVSAPAAAFQETYDLLGGEIRMVEVPQSIIHYGSEIVDVKSIHVTSDAEVTVYGLNRERYTADAFLALPVDILNTTYMIASYTGLGYANNASEFLIVSPYDQNHVTITPKGYTVGGRSADVPFDIVLNRGETYEVQSTNGDMTGSLVQSSLPVAVFGGHGCANVPLGYPYCDHLVEQMPPLSSLGTSFLSLPLGGRANGDTFRVLATQDGTDLYVNGALAATLGLGAFWEVNNVEIPQVIETNKPAIVMQYANGNEWDPNVPANGDPAMIMIPPTQQFQRGYSFSTPVEGYGTNFVNVVCRDVDAGGIHLDGALVNQNLFQPIGASGYVGAQVPLTLGSHRIDSADQQPFGIYVYGLDSDDAYGYPGGLSLEIINEGSAPVVQRTAETEELSLQSQPYGADLVIGADVSDAEAPYVQSVTLHYRRTGTSPYSQMDMLLLRDGTYAATIPGAEVQDPGVDYYLSATDGQFTTTSPALSPDVYPYAIAVMPNYPPVISHDAVSTGYPGEEIPITAQITDETHFVQSAELYYRRSGIIAYASVPMIADGDNYTASIPADQVTLDGVAYYIRAVDDLGLASYHGSSDRPHRVSVVEPIGSVDLISPVDGAHLNDARPEMLWHRALTAIPTDSARYSLLWSRDPEFVDHDSAFVATDTSYVFADNVLESQTEYFWKVLGRTDGGRERWSYRWSFVTADITPVLLMPQASSGETGIRLTWHAVDGEGVLSYRVWRQDADTPWAAVSPVMSEDVNEYLDTQVEVGVLYEYEIETREIDGSVRRFGPITAQFQAPTRLTFAVQPNPGMGNVTLAFSLPRAGDVTARVFDPQGREVATCAIGGMRAGVHHVSWQPVDSNGRALASGSYYLRLDTPSGQRTTRWVVLR